MRGPIGLPPPPCQLLLGIWAAWGQLFPSHSEGRRGGCLAGLPLAEAQVQAVLKAPRTTSPPPRPQQAGQTGKYQT